MLKLVRAYLDNCCIGKLYHQGELQLYTVERPWLNNEKNISCIPPGIYNIQQFNSKKHPDSFLLINRNLGVGNDPLSQRTACLFHSANFPYEVNGCIGPGLELHPTTWGVKDSKKAMTKLSSLIHTNSISQIEIT